MKACLNFISPSGFQRGAPSVLIISKFQNRRAISTLISMYARLKRRYVSHEITQLGINTHFFPMQFLGPRENGCAAFFTSPSYSFSIHLSGINSSGFLKCAGLWVDDHAPTLTVVPPGKNRPSTVSPPGGTTRGGPAGTGGWIRRTSSMQALR